MLGGIRALDGDRILRLVSEAGSGLLFEIGAAKVCIVRAD